jgi:hypothetical protein
VIHGLDLFREHFAPFKGTFVLIGGVACHEWLATQELPFRATKDMEMVLIAEALDPPFNKRLKRGEEVKGDDIAKHRTVVF